MYQKLCKRCKFNFESISQNSQFCKDCVWTYKKKGPRESKYKMNRVSLRDPDFYSYLMGFCCSDGSVQEHPSGKAKTVRYLSTDLEIVEKITQKLEYTRPISINREFNDHRKTCWENILYSDNARYFHSKGLTPDKTKLSIDNMDISIFPYLRGLLDGDGSIKVESRQVDFLGQKILLESIQKRLLELDFEVHPPRDAGGTYIISVGGLLRIRKLLGLMYENPTIYLDRKFELAQQVFDRKDGRVRYQGHHPVSLES